MLCDFTAGVQLLAADFLAAWRATHIIPPLWPQKYPDDVTDLLKFELVRAGSWHNTYPGETRVALDLTRLVSFYDTALVPSLVPLRAAPSVDRWDHRLQNISATDLAAVNARLRAVLSVEKHGGGSGVDWRTLYRGVVDRYADRLELLAHLLNTTAPGPANPKKIQVQLRIMLTPYILYAAQPVSDASTSDDAWAVPVWRLCATRQTAHIHALRARLTRSERLLLGALDETTREICRVVTRMWAAGVRAGLDPLIQIPTPIDSSGHSTPLDSSAIVESWRTETRTLMAWLDWSVWVKCRPACGDEVRFPSSSNFVSKRDADGVVMVGNVLPPDMAVFLG
jgi:hypothetical protein